MRKDLLKAAWIVSLIWTIFLGLYIIPLAWMIPFNVMIYKAYKEEKEPSGVFVFLYAIFSGDSISATLMVLAEGKLQRRLYVYACAVFNTIVMGALLVPLAWMIPMTLKLRKYVVSGEDMSVAFRILYYLFMFHPFGALVLLFEPETKVVAEVK